MRSRLVVVSLALAVVFSALWPWAARNDRRGDYREVPPGEQVTLLHADFTLASLRRVDRVTDAWDGDFGPTANAVLVQATIAYDATAADAPPEILCTMSLVGEGGNQWTPESITSPEGEPGEYCTGGESGEFRQTFEIPAAMAGQVRGVGLSVFDGTVGGESVPDHLLLGSVS